MRLRPLLAVVAVLFGALAAAAADVDPPVVFDRPLPEWMLVHRVESVYPPLAVEHRIQGVVRFSAVIGKDGRVEGLRLVRGHPLLVPAARAAVLQWVYRPYLERGAPVRIVAPIEVPFRLGLDGKPQQAEQRPEPKA